MSGELEVRFGERAVGSIRADDATPFCFTYDPAWLGSVDAFPVSLSLPLRPEPWLGPTAAAWFGNLLPEGTARQAVCGRLGISESNDVELLRAIGGECAGALTIVDPLAPPVAPPQAGSAPYEPLDARRLASLVAQGATPLLIGGPGMRLSLAGAQNKLPVVLVDGQLCLPAGGSPSTHLLKLPHPRFAHLPMNEAYVMGLAARIGLDVARVQVYTGTSPPSLLVERYDRRPAASGSAIIRLHQEDFCQATGRSAGRKYQQEGGPSLPESVTLVARHTARPLVEVRRLIEWQAFNVVVGNCDGHGKNLSLLRDGRSIRLAPFYDVLSTRQYPMLDRNLAMTVGERRDPDTLLRHHWETFAAEASLGSRLVVEVVAGVVERVAAALPGWSAEYAEQHGRQAVLQTLPRWIAKNAAGLARRMGSV